MFRFWQKQSPTPATVVASHASRVMSFNHDGMELAKVKRRRNRYLPIWHVIFFVYFILLVRLMAMAEMGVASYQSRIDTLSQGNAVERVAATVMYMDPVSRSIAIDLRKALQSWAAYTSGE